MVQGADSHCTQPAITGARLAPVVRAAPKFALETKCVGTETEIKDNALLPVGIYAGRRHFDCFPDPKLLQC